MPNCTDSKTEKVVSLDGDLLAMESTEGAKESQNAKTSDIDAFACTNKAFSESSSFRTHLTKESSDMMLTTTDQISSLKRGDKHQDENGSSNRQYEDFEFGMNEPKCGLIEATAVYNFSEEDIYIPAAIEFDPDSKMTKKPGKRFKPIVFLCVAMVLLAILAVVGVVVRKELQPKDENSVFDKRKARASLGISETITKLIGEETLQGGSASYRQALEWITYTDPAALHPDHPKFLQRYVAAYLYFATSQDRGWAYCAPPLEQDSNNCIFSRILDRYGFHRNQPTERIFAMRWLSAIDECRWAGVTCNKDNNVISLNLQGMDMTGYFPHGILQHLPFLTDLSLGGELRGPLPPELRGLTSLDVSQNNFIGTIPETWYTSHIEHLNLRGNMISGSLSSTVGMLSGLTNMIFHDNELTGTIPNEIGNLSNLGEIYLQENKLTGVIPTALSRLSKLILLRLGHNELRGSIPPQFENLLFLTEFFVEGNSLSGSIPIEVYTMSRLVTLDLSNNALTGTIGSGIGQLTRMKRMALKDNRFWGTLPSELGLLRQLIGMSVSGTNLTGVMPAGVCITKSHNKKFEQLEANCLSDKAGFGADVACSCCDVCCNVDGMCSPM